VTAASAATGRDTLHAAQPRGTRMRRMQAGALRLLPGPVAGRTSSELDYATCYQANHACSIRVLLSEALRPKPS
jgi:hypothetical protein